MGPYCTYKCKKTKSNQCLVLPWQCLQKHTNRGTFVSPLLNGASVVLHDMVSVEVEVVSVLELLNTKFMSSNSLKLSEGLFSIASTL
jgi:hypothetical protein